ncbi:hypothetical protein CRE_17324 [Caenorhabditis remanei]|uniref:Uncharacterized protein n=1 Tax=Caenorhabditis remanei TaxID=31234 RepID=E3MRX1_CAERE|nr:hypothetical protein CRE_17324 [Caenorhabditis remanei]
MSGSEEEHLVSALTFRKNEDENDGGEEESADDVGASGAVKGPNKKMEFVNQNFVESTEDESDLSTPTAVGPPLGSADGDETPTFHLTILSSLVTTITTMRGCTPHLSN